MKQFYSLSQYPGTTGETYYRKFFSLKNLLYTYTALKCDNIVDSVDELKTAITDRDKKQGDYYTETVNWSTKRGDFLYPAQVNSLTLADTYQTVLKQKDSTNDQIAKAKAAKRTR